MTPGVKYQHGQYLKRFEAFVAAPPLAGFAFERQVRDFLEALRPSQRHHARAALHDAYPDRLDWSRFRVRKHRRNEARLQRTIFSGDEWAQLGAVLATRPGERALFYVLATLRRAEAAALRWENLDLGRSMVYVLDGKGGTSRPTMLLPRAAEALTAWWQARGSPASGLVFPHAGLGPRGTVRPPQQVTPEAIGYRVFRLLRQAGLYRPWRGAHAMRRTFATRYLSRNADDLVGLKKLLRHENLETTCLYVFLTPDDLAPRLARVEL